ncbi:MAG: PAS domain-containing protein [Hydrogenophilus sp.]|nr:PAS domain-containing protein [Hydrogenophilus sp.]
MKERAVTPTEREFSLREHALLVSRSDPNGFITYANRDLLEASGYDDLHGLLNRPHRVLRHPWMPRGIYHLMWKKLKAGKEFFGFFKNIRRDGDHYWVFVHVLPEAHQGKNVGFIASRRPAPFAAVQKMERVYERMNEVERLLTTYDPLKQCTASVEELRAMVRRFGYEKYSHFVRDLYEEGGGR